MTRDAKLFVLTNAEGKTNIIHDISRHPNVDKLIRNISIYQIGKRPEHRYLVLSVSDEVDEILLINGAEEKYDIAVEKLKTERQAHEPVFGNETLIEFLYSEKIR
jgi:hypothetical protein